MGKLDQMERVYLKNPVYFADAFNYAIFHGENVIHPEDLTEQDTAQTVALVRREIDNFLANMEPPREPGNAGTRTQDDESNADSSKKPDDARHGNLKKSEAAKRKAEKYIDVYRDVYKEAAVMTDGKATYVLLGIEAQSAPHRAMAIQVMLKDAASYATQARFISDRNHAAKKVSGTDFISGFLPEDRVKPVITLVVLFSADSWNMPRSLSELFEEYDPRLAQYVQDYRLNIIVPSEIEDFSLFSSDLGPMMEFMKCTNDKHTMSELLDKKRSLFHNFDSNAAQIIGHFAKIRPEELKNAKTEDGGVNMCKAWEDHAQEVAERATKELQAENALLNSKISDLRSENSDLKAIAAAKDEEIALLHKIIANNESK